MNELAIKEIEAFRSNEIIMKLVTDEAVEKTASDIRAKTGSGTTAKAVALLAIRNEKVKNRVDMYIAAGLVGCYMAKHK